LQAVMDRHQRRALRSDQSERTGRRGSCGMAFQGKQRPSREVFEHDEDDFKEQGQSDPTDEEVEVDMPASGQSSNSRR